MIDDCDTWKTGSEGERHFSEKACYVEFNYEKYSFLLVLASLHKVKNILVQVSFEHWVSKIRGSSSMFLAQK